MREIPLELFYTFDDPELPTRTLTDEERKAIPDERVCTQSLMKGVSKKSQDYLTISFEKFNERFKGISAYKIENKAGIEKHRLYNRIRRVRVYNFTEYFRMPKNEMDMLSKAYGEDFSHMIIKLED